MTVRLAVLLKKFSPQHQVIVPIHQLMFDDQLISVQDDKLWKISWVNDDLRQYPPAEWTVAVLRGRIVGTHGRP